MNQIDILIILGCLVGLIRGRASGFVRQLFSTTGFFVGLLLAVLLDSKVIHLFGSSVSRSVVTLIFNLGMAFLISGLAEVIAIRLKYRIKWPLFQNIDASLGSILRVATILVIVWLGAAIAVKLPFPELQDNVRQSAVVRWLNRTLPPAPGVVSKLSNLIEPNGFPRVFNGAEPSPGSATLPTASSLRPAVDADEPSIIKIQGAGCGGIVDGSGFIIANGIVATNAHVVAGIKSPRVIDQRGGHKASTIWFDPSLDIAFLRVSGLSGMPLRLQTAKAVNGSAAAVVGYPGGGSFDAQPAVVVDNITALGRNIYDRGLTRRDIYELKSTVRPGNSGGPLLAADGSVLGVVFAESTQYNNVGYALTINQVVLELAQSKNRQTAVSTGPCT